MAVFGETRHVLGSALNRTVIVRPSIEGDLNNMNRRIVALGLLALLPMGSALADPDAGCGAGSKIWEGQSGTIYKLMAATTNASFGNQTFGITSGTLGCHQDGTVRAENRVPMFASANMDRLAADMAAGHGDSLEALAALYNINDADRSGFYALTQSHYKDIFTSANVTSELVVANLRSVMQSDSRFARYVA